MSKIGAQGGMSLTTGFDVKFDFGATNKPFVTDYYTGNNLNIVNMLCDEAQLPNVQSGVAQIAGRYLGEGPVSYPHTKIYTDVSLGFLLDADLTPLKFFTGWYDYIFGEGTPRTHTGNIEGALGTAPRKRTRTNRLKYMNEYVCNAKIVKTETGTTSSNERAPVVFILEDCYPYAIDAVPLAYGTSQLTRLTVNLYYSRHTISYGNIKNIR